MTPLERYAIQRRVVADALASNSPEWARLFIARAVAALDELDQS